MILRLAFTVSVTRGNSERCCRGKILCLRRNATVAGSVTAVQQDSHNGVSQVNNSPNTNTGVPSMEMVGWWLVVRG